MQREFASSAHDERTLAGDMTGRDIVIGPAWVLADEIVEPADRFVPEGRERDAEEARFLAAVEYVARAYTHPESSVENLPIESREETAKMIESEGAILRDHRPVIQAIRNGKDAARAVFEHYNFFLTFFGSSDDPMIVKQALPTESVLKQLLQALIPGLSAGTLSTAPAGSIPVTGIMPVGMMSRFRDADGQVRLPGMLNSGGTHSDHTNIVARSAGITVARINAEERARIKSGDILIIDGRNKKVIINPGAQTLARYEEQRDRGRARQTTLLQRAQADNGVASTRDGETVTIKGNIGFSDDLPAVNALRTHGIGLYRTELAIQLFENEPEKKFWHNVFTHIAGRLGQGSLTIRTIDLEGDKLNERFSSQKSRDLIVRRQMAAALSTAAESGADRINVMVPMISSAAELHTHQAIIDAEAARLGLPSLKLGVMVELPSLLDDLENTDAAFFSIGTNDLTANILKFDRFGPEAAERNDPTDPAVLAAIQRTVDAGRAKDIPVSVCGDMAGNPRYTALLLGAGVRTLSAGPAALPAVMEMARRIDTREASALFDAVAAAPDRDARRQMLDDFNRRHGFDRDGLALDWTASAAAAKTPVPALQ